MEEVKESEAAEFQNVDKGTPAPWHTLEFCISMIREIISQRGDGLFTKKEAAILLGKSEGNMSIKLGACGHYGLLENDKGRGYRATALYDKIELYTSIEEKNAALLTAASSPAVFKRIIQDYNGKVLPPNERMFVNLLTGTYGMVKGSAEIAARVFVKNGKSLGIIDSSNRLKFLMPTINESTSSDNTDTNTESDVDSDTSKQQEKQSPPNDTMFEQPINLGTKTAYLKYPKDITIAEIAVLKIMLTASLTALEAMQDIQNKAPQSRAF